MNTDDAGTMNKVKGLVRINVGFRGFYINRYESWIRKEWFYYMIHLEYLRHNKVDGFDLPSMNDLKLMKFCNDALQYMQFEYNLSKEGLELYCKRKGKDPLLRESAVESGNA